MVKFSGIPPKMKRMPLDFSSNCILTPEDRSGVEITELPDDSELSIYLDYPFEDPSPKTTKTCREWADETEGEIATTLY